MITQNISMLNDLTPVSFIVRIVLAALLGGLMGFEREQKQRPAGFRTYVIVCIGSTLACITGIYLFKYVGGSDPARIPAQVISGIGFLGAGTILVTRNSHVKGLTTAAGLWCAATIGIAVGCGLYLGAIFTSLIIVSSLKFLSFVDKSIQKRQKYISIFMEYTEVSIVKSIIKYTKVHDIKLNDLSMYDDIKSGTNVATFTLILSSPTMADDILKDLYNMDGVTYIERI